MILATLSIAALLLPTAVVRQAAGSTPSPAGTAPSSASPQGLSPDDARSSIKRAVKFLLETQNKDGSWCSGAIENLQEAQYSFALETWYAFKVGANGLAVMALLSVDEPPERRAALDRAVRWMLDSRVPRRGNEWDVDYAWSSLYGFNSMVQVAKDPRFQGAAWKDKVKERALMYYALLTDTQEPSGGWGYYEGPVVSRRPTWATSFATASVVPALVDAKKVLGWPVDESVTKRAVEYLTKCALPSGAYTYDYTAVPRINGGEMINDVKGSLSRMQVCNWALRRAGVPTITDEKIRASLGAFFREHKFLDVARLKPIPHEAYYQNAAYFYFFGHCYAGQLIQELPQGEREAWHAKLRGEIVKCQWGDGSCMDFLGSAHLQVAATSFAVLALNAGVQADKAVSGAK